MGSSSNDEVTRLKCSVEIAQSLAVLSGHSKCRAKPQLPRICIELPQAFALVRQQQRGLLQGVHPSRVMPIVWSYASAGVDDEQQNIGALRQRPRLRQSARQQGSKATT